ncbi:MAG: hypothetical protein F6K24_02865 [Okeania sp. SIO2D1]|nr:hypothetical protein [Okeania sp. SIO2D1]
MDFENFQIWAANFAFEIKTEQDILDEQSYNFLRTCYANIQQQEEAEEIPTDGDIVKSKEVSDIAQVLNTSVGAVADLVLILREERDKAYIEQGILEYRRRQALNAAGEEIAQSLDIKHQLAGLEGNQQQLRQVDVLTLATEALGIDSKSLREDTHKLIGTHRFEKKAKEQKVKKTKRREASDALNFLPRGSLQKYLKVEQEG